MGYKQTIEERINALRRQVLIHSCLYYRFNESLISDTEYDRRARELMDLQKKYPEIAQKCVYADAFSNFSETTSGFDLPTHDPWVVNTALEILKYHQKRDEKKVQELLKKYYGSQKSREAN